MFSDTWNVVLAAGAGRRLWPLTGGLPKQFWRPDGRTSLLEDTLDRLAPLAPPARTMTIVDRSHRPYVEAFDVPSRMGTVVYQPSDRGTAAGVLLALSTIVALTPEALVVMTPSDHGVAHDDLFRAGIDIASRNVRSRASDIVLLGVQPDHPHGDYGWITPRKTAPPWQLATVAGFVEKPPVAQAMDLKASGAVWNTMVFVARASRLIALYREHLPRLHEAFLTVQNASAANYQDELDAAYATLPSYDFSRDLLTPACGLSLIVWPGTMGWSDLGTPERMRAWRGCERLPATATSSAA
jgi:mannose-1-phosphate guanylyltransferase